MHPILALRFRLCLLLLAIAWLGLSCGNQPLKVVSYNTYYVFAEGKQVDAATQWISAEAPGILALQELTNISEDRLSELAAGWGHQYSALLKSSGFSVGLSSTQPIEVVERIIDGLHHGCLHARIAGIEVFVVHLSPFKWSVRTQETEILLGKIQPLLDRGSDVLVLGDFNAASPADQSLLAAQPELLQKLRASDQAHGHVENLREGQIDFRVMQKFLDAGLVDTALPFLELSGMPRWTIPSGFGTEAQSEAPKQGERVDFVLASPSLARGAVSARVCRVGAVNRVSDHLPVIVEMRRGARQPKD